MGQIVRPSSRFPLRCGNFADGWVVKGFFTMVVEGIIPPTLGRRVVLALQLQG